jgi:ribosomal protein S18 acetylase RimI-like enzyme
MSHALLPGAAEIKRACVRPGSRGMGAAHAARTALIGSCRAQGFARNVMDTGKARVAVQRLYEAMGFRRGGPCPAMPEAARGVMIRYEMAP